MPRQKDLKRLVRARMTKTGEAYTAARAQILRKTAKSVAARDFVRTRSDLAVVAGMSDAPLRTKTGKTWEEWVRALDGHRASERSHREIAVLLRETFGVGDWWSQAITVGYERIKGLRERGQRRDGKYEANKSRTYAVPVATLFEAWADPKIRRRWLDDVRVTTRTASAPRSMRLGLPDGAIVAVGFTAKGRAKSAVAIQHTKLPDRVAVERTKEAWTKRLDALAEVLSSR